MYAERVLATPLMMMKKLKSGIFVYILTQEMRFCEEIVPAKCEKCVAKEDCKGA